MIKKRENFITTNSIKFNKIKIKFDKNKTINIKHASYVKNILFIKTHKSSIINFKNISKKINIKR